MPNELIFAWALSGFFAILALALTLKPLKTTNKKNNADKTTPRRWGVFFRRFPWMIVTVMFFLLVSGVVVGLRGYRAFVREDIVGTLEVVRAGDDDQFVAMFTPHGGSTIKAALTGDQVQVDAKVLKWTPAMNFLGLHTNYELDRIVGRHSNVDDENRLSSKATSLGDDRTIDLFHIARMVSWMRPVVDASYGSSSFVSAGDGEKWELLISTSGLLFRPLSPK